MAKDLNLCIFIGRIGKDHSLKFMPSGKAVLSFSIACSDDYKNKETGETIKQTNWINVSAFGSQAQALADYTGKGSCIQVSGKQQTRKWQDKAGNNQYTTEIVLQNFQFLDKKPSQNDQQSNQQPAQSQHQSSQRQDIPDMGGEPFDDDMDIPF